MTKTVRNCRKCGTSFGGKECVLCKRKTDKVRRDANASQGPRGMAWKLANPGMKCCSKCKSVLPASRDNFLSREGGYLGFSTVCILCNRKRNLERYYTKEGQEVRRKYISENIEKKKAYDKNYRSEHKKEIRAYQNAWEKLNKDKVNGYVRAQKERNPDKFIEKRRLYYLRMNNSPEGRMVLKARHIISAQRRRARMKEVDGILSHGIIDRLMKLQKGKCACCGVLLKGKFHLDHIMPIALGGNNEDSNMQLLLPKCNLRKHKKHPIDYMQEKGFLL